MKRLLVVGLALLSLVGVLSPAALAQAPAPKVTISGLLDMVTSMSENLRDANFARAGDREWYSRTRFRPELAAEVGSVKAVWGLEIDTVWGQVSGSDTNTTIFGVAGAAQRVGTTSGFDLNTDTQGSIEVKWLYLEFPVPLVPVPTTVRLGAQPAAATYKLGTLFSGDFAGVNLVTTWAPNVKTHLTYVQIEEDLTGGSTGGTGATAFVRGDDFAAIASVEYAPIKGLDIRPIYALAWFQGATSASARQAPGQITGAVPAFQPNREEYRHTIGVDARWRWGALSVDPTFFYQFGTRETNDPFAGVVTAPVTEADIRAWLVDVLAGHRVGPFLLEARYMYSSGNRPKDQLWRDVNYFQPINTDTNYWGEYRWSNIYAQGIDYGNGSILGMAANISLNRYGRQQFQVRGIYSATPALDLYATVSPAWTARSADTDANPYAAANCAAHSVNDGAAFLRGQGCQGDSSYIGTETNLGLTWRFAPGLTLEIVGAVLFAGDALDISEIRNGVLTPRGAEDVYTGVARVRYTF